MRRVAAFLVVGVLLSSCAPRVTSQPDLPVTALGEAEGQALVQGFLPALSEAGVTVTRVSAFAYQGSQGGAFEQATRRFYALNPGFCPVQGGFLTRGSDYVYLTLAARGLDVRAFVYDQTNRPTLTYAYLEGKSTEALPTNCPPK